MAAPTRALVGHSGFVGSNLARDREWSARFNSANVEAIAGQSFDLVVCAAAPATMWAANQNPAADKANIDRLVAALAGASVGHFVLVSTIAVLDRADAGYDEDCAAFEGDKAYGRHRRALELAVAEQFARHTILRLPALFGPGLKKNFLFDLANPAPSFLRGEAWDAALARLGPADADLLRRHYRWDAALAMWALDRAGLQTSGERSALEGVVIGLDLEATRFTNSASRFQYYDVTGLADHIDLAVGAGLELLHLAPEPLSAGEVSAALSGTAFDNSAPALYAEDMHSRHAALFLREGPYLFGRDAVLAQLRAFHAGARGA